MVDVDTRFVEAFEVRRHRRNIAAFICLCLVMGVSQGLVLCVSCDGDVVLRPGLHAHEEHAACGSIPTLAQQPADDHEDESDHHHCGRCVDVPLSMYAIDRGVSDDDTDLPAFFNPVEAHASGAQADALALRPIRASDETPYYTPLRTVILVV